MYELKDYLKAVNQTKEPLMDGEDEEWERKYPPFIVNKCVAPFPDTIMLVNEINQLPHLDKKLQFDFLINSLRPRKRYTPWLKAMKLENLEYVKEYYGYSNEKAKSALDILTDEQILHKQGRYFIVHFKELFALDGKNTNLTENDISRRNTITNLLKDWGLVNIIGEMGELAPLSQIKVLSYSEKADWTLETKYNIGKKKEV